VRLTTLLDMIDQGGSGPWLTPSTDSAPASTPGSAGTTSPTLPLESEAFDQLVASLIPCRAYDAELWFAERADEVEQAKALCQQCPVRAGCLAGAIERAEPWGVWGGEVFIGGVVVPRKRGRGRPRKDESTAA